ncbi:hypothetical protein [Rhodoferax sp.]|uniref:hypothetical protein n=1 Tax=Rhodoferax sp. TaxID=50421 RepID=UPI0008B54DBB|nr:hypothetical protein [Rhodoferax sp.]MDO8318695.1 hypothetical protein [Rhodoferax sp.]OGB50462.1 MAG: hypothetical protein A2503_19145 [Burkholderiales bacterium RIFOXYD12_FULL_59_19]OGB81931.1 MAG: hypothetical protein A2496_05645 [Burkholderiales bacterium RIFOXYC12_FULL_60_6]
MKPPTASPATVSFSTARRQLCPGCSQLLQRVHRTGWQRWLPLSKKLTCPACRLSVFQWLGLRFELN